ncbi:MAG: Gfo/Idh/MocA family oxidoreductase [Fimbriimonas ginsengisoli]|uniref:Gfo/Idh/MocA family oxidoreductase n=1 Tax=Fimbriimonas ginsengisoli TaxID=1005039 RepID=A0A931LZC2_FIMGI|nr:Gfo/Idh/MocA family oxidoreductase [Fimbriimonas ginsengisoli]MBI3721024.1 Gfo/Idh/MocA family oxidoreductase [Fimbriimonas ginsengisoli]
MTRVGLVGAGGMGNVHARQYAKMPDVELRFYELDPERAKAYAERWQVQPSESVDGLMTWCDAVDVCLPTDLHLDLGLEAIAAGKALLMEKPAARTFEDACGLAKAAEDAAVPYMPAQVVRFFPEFAKGHDLVESGAVGRAATARTHRGGGAPSGAGGWFMDHTRSGGILLDLAIHDFDWLRWTLGEVTAVNGRSVAAKKGIGPDYALTTFSFDSGAIAHVESTWMDPSGFRTAFEVCGSEGMIEFDSRRATTLRTSQPDKTASEAPLSSTDDPYYRQIRAFIDTVQAGTTPPVSGWDGAMAVSIALAALESAKTGQTVAPKRP